MEMGKSTVEVMTKQSRILGGYDPVWVIINRLTKAAHSLPYKTRQK